eukprot:Gregarina_sp_Poly_1__9871@NODE_63_length_16525_cov_103_439847_g54_i0_p1_GENE_NODE_63_length_16525_cov_103_439847_g54_i0NODE_63_length_16525_cov_103_439847_g54_i0_p1_ORF_typecomplete_len1946_score275_09ANAPC4_WD40/PF12894_7/0_0013ANAPC4_WD40/PF12894_7/6_7e02ANAPC4_WD40/PF12894_7/8_7ANAPC4_WD40/PF12894_7/3e02WD40/PF00400_32/6_5WD40/PF00400_32/0_0029WD40/PF00400_32/7_7e02WD40_like/PF17005_5/8_4e06Bromodomain/PF00439_25/0_0022Ge1_WD40/PF16529_5/0_018Ge1_WD40/PF16529_5/1_4e03_NODE_63_length_16525_cov
MAYAATTSCRDSIDELTASLVNIAKRLDSKSSDATWQDALRAFHKVAKQATASVSVENATHTTRHDLIGFAHVLQQEEIAQQQQRRRRIIVESTNVGCRVDRILGFRKVRSFWRPTQTCHVNVESGRVKNLSEDIVNIPDLGLSWKDEELTKSLMALRPQLTVWGHQYFETCKQRQEIAGRPCPVPFVCYWNENIVTAGHDGFIKFWDSHTLRLRASIKRHLSDITCIKWYSTDNLLVSGDRLGHVRLWKLDLDNGSGWIPLSTLHLESQIIFISRLQTDILDLLLVGTQTGQFCVCDTQRMIRCVRLPGVPPGSVCEDCKLMQVRGFPSAESRVFDMGAHVCDVQEEPSEGSSARICTVSLNVWNSINPIITAESVTDTPGAAASERASTMQRQQQRRRIAQIVADFDNDSFSLLEAHRRKRMVFKRGIDLAVPEKALCACRRAPQLTKVRQPADFEIVWPQRDAHAACLAHYKLVLDVNCLHVVDASGQLQMLQQNEAIPCCGFRSAFDPEKGILAAVADSGYINIWRLRGDRVEKIAETPSPLRVFAARNFSSSGMEEVQRASPRETTSPMQSPAVPRRLLNSTLLASLGSRSALMSDSKAVSDATTKQSKSKQDRAVCVVGATALSIDKRFLFFSEGSMTVSRSRRNIDSSAAKTAGLAMVDTSTGALVRTCFYDRKLGHLISFIAPHPILRHVLLVGNYGGCLFVIDIQRDLIMWSHQASGTEWLAGAWRLDGTEFVSVQQFGSLMLFSPFKGDLHHSSFFVNESLGDGPCRNLISYCFPLNPRFAMTPLVQFMNLDFTPIIEVSREISGTTTQEMARRLTGDDGHRNFWGHLFDPHYSRQPHEIHTELQIVSSDRSAHARDLPPTYRSDVSAEKRRFWILSSERILESRRYIDRYFVAEDASLRLCIPVPRTRPPLFPQFLPPSRGGPSLVWPQPSQNTLPSPPAQLLEAEGNDGEQEADIDFVASSSSSSSDLEVDEEDSGSLNSEMSGLRVRNRVFRRAPSSQRGRTGRVNRAEAELSSNSNVPSDGTSDDDEVEASPGYDEADSDVSDEEAFSSPGSSVASEQPASPSIATTQVQTSSAMAFLSRFFEWSANVAEQNFRCLPFHCAPREEIWTLHRVRQRFGALLLLLAPSLEHALDREELMQALPRWVFEWRREDVSEGCWKWLKSELANFDSKTWTPVRIAEALFEEEPRSGHGPLNDNALNHQCLLCSKRGDFCSTAFFSVAKPLMEEFEAFVLVGPLKQLVAEMTHKRRKTKTSDQLPPFVDTIVADVLRSHTTDHVANSLPPELPNPYLLVGTFRSNDDKHPFLLHLGCLQSLTPRQELPVFSSGPIRPLSEEDLRILIRQNTSRLLRDQSSSLFSACDRCQIHTAHLRCLFCKKHFHWICGVLKLPNTNEGYNVLRGAWSIMAPAEFFKRTGTIICEGCSRTYWWPLLLTGGNCVDASVATTDIPKIGSIVHFFSQESRLSVPLFPGAEWDGLCIGVRYYLEDFCPNKVNFEASIRNLPFVASALSRQGNDSFSFSFPVLSSITLDQSGSLFTTRRMALCTFVVMPPHQSAGVVIELNLPNYNIAYMTDRHEALYPVYQSTLQGTLSAGADIRHRLKLNIADESTLRERCSLNILAARQSMDLGSIDATRILQQLELESSPLTRVPGLTKEQWLTSMRIIGTLIISPEHTGKLSRMLSFLSEVGHQPHQCLQLIFDSDEEAFKKARSMLNDFCSTPMFADFCSSLDAPPESLLSRVKPSPRKISDIAERPLPDFIPLWRQAYASTIPRPITLIDIFDAVKSGRYLHKLQIFYDLLLLKSNCHVFNTPNSGLGSLSSLLLGAYETLTQNTGFSRDMTAGLTTSQIVASSLSASILGLEQCLFAKGLLSEEEARCLLSTRTVVPSASDDTGSISKRRRRRMVVGGTDDEAPPVDDIPLPRAKRRRSSRTAST